MPDLTPDFDFEPSYIALPALPETGQHQVVAVERIETEWLYKPGFTLYRILDPVVTPGFRQGGLVVVYAGAKTLRPGLAIGERVEVGRVFQKDQCMGCGKSMVIPRQDNGWLLCMEHLKVLRKEDVGEEQLRRAELYEEITKQVLG